MGWGVVTGLESEARLFGPMARAGGGTPAGAAGLAEQFAAEGAAAIISFGFAGGLDPSLRPGFMVIPAHVVSAASRWTCDPVLLERLGGATVESVFAADAVVPTAEGKAAARRRSGASAVDLESGAVASAAARHGLPFAVIRAVCDPAERSLPRAALLAMDQQGRVGLGRVLGALILEPGQLPALLRLAADAARARTALASFLVTLKLEGACLRAS